MQSVSNPAGKKSSGFKCPTFSVPAKPKDNQSSSSSKPSEQVVPAPIKPGPGGDTDSDSKRSATEVLKPTEHGDSGSKPTGHGDIYGSNAGDISNETDSKKEVSSEPVKSETKTTEESLLPKKIAKKKAKFCMKPSATVGLSSSKLDNENKKAENKIKKSKSEKCEKSEKDKTKKLEKSEKVRKTTDSKKDKPIKDDKNSSKGKEKEKQSLPGRSLSDAEYDTIFNSVLETALNRNMEDWQPKTTSPVKVKEPVKKKYKITVGKKVKQVESDRKPDNSMVDGALEEPAKSPVIDTTDDADVCSEEEIVHTVNVGLDDEADDVDNKADDVDDESVAEDKPDENNNVDAVDESVDNPPVVADDENVAVNEENANVEEMESSVQGENEVTPPVSVTDVTEKLPVNVATPIKKKKKILKAKKKLEPKHLPFNESKETSMVDKICKMKQLKKSKGEVTAKKERLIDCRKDNVHSKPVKSSENKISKKRKMQQRELDSNGTWVLCCNSGCQKWRYLHSVCDPSLVPERWTCSMNTNTEYNSCDRPEEKYDESEHIYTKFTEGSVVWAKMTGYPWWPAMVEIDPDTETFFSVDSEDSMFPTHYHVVFFDDHVSRIWVKSELVVQFTGEEEDDGVVIQSSKKRGPSYKNDIAKAKKNALNAQKCTLKERIELFGFAARYKGPWASNNKKAKTKKVKIALKQEKIEENEYLDDNTVDDVLENTESLLDNVEEMLNSLDSQLDDTDEDSDFAPDELVVVEKKSKTGRRIVETKASKTNVSDIENSEKKVSFNTTEDSDIVCHDDQAKGDSRNINIEPDDKVTTDVPSKTKDKPDGKKRKKVEKVNDNNKHNESKTIKKKKVNEEMKVKTKVGNKKTKMDDEEDKKLKTVDEEVKEEEKGKILPEICEMEVDIKEAESAHNDVQNVNNVNDVADTEADEFDLLAEEEGETHVKSVGKEEGNKEVEEFDLLADEEDPEDDKSANNDIASEKRNDDKLDDDDDDFELVDNEAKTKSEAEKNDAKLGDDDFDLDDETDTKSKAENNDDDDFDLIDEVVSKPEAVVPHRNIEQSLDDEDGDDFDLEDHFMYDTNTDTTDKIRELSNLNGNIAATTEIATAEIEEYSDPFDLMEE